MLFKSYVYMSEYSQMCISVTVNVLENIYFYCIKAIMMKYNF